MKLLKEIFRDHGLDLAGRTLERESAKAIIRQGRKLLMVSVAQGRAYKFPGGGVNPGEIDEQTLARELLEECGAWLISVEGEFGQVVEYKHPFEPEYDAFKLTSRYYLCQVKDGFEELRLDTYEAELDFYPVWVDLDAAIQTNRGLLGLGEAGIPSWIGRETYVLEQVKQQIFGEQD